MPLVHVFREGRAVGTALLWVAVFANLLAVNFLTSWLPTMMVGAGLPLRQAVWASVLFMIGSIIGAVSLGRLTDQLGPYRVLAIGFLVGAVAVMSIGSAGGRLPLVLGLSIAAGFCLGGGQIGLNAVAGIYYPTSIRSTGVGWAMGIGRLGAVLSGFVGTVLLAWHWSLPAIFLTDGLFALCAACSILLVGVRQRSNSIGIVR